MPWIDLPDIKAHLNKTDTTDDTELQGFIDAACAAIEDIKGHVDVDTFTCDGHTRSLVQFRRYWAYWGNRFRYVIELPETPVLDISSVSWLTGDGTLTPISADDDTTDPDEYLGWRLSDCLLYLPYHGEYRISYTAGRNPVPGNFRLAALELAAHLWKGSQLNAQAGGRPGIYSGDQTGTMPGVASAMPFRVRELLGLYGEIVNDHVVIA